jgi:hypothetical protein
MLYFVLSRHFGCRWQLRVASGCAKWDPIRVLQRTGDVARMDGATGSDSEEASQYVVGTGREKKSGLSP